jgi:hypothetical protein
VLEGDHRALTAADRKGVLELLAISHAGMTTDDFSRTVSGWLANARHSRFGRPYDKLVYQPMLELMAYLRANGFKTFIVSGGGVEFIRVFVEKTYGIPPEQVVGSSRVTKFQMGVGGDPVLLKGPEVEFIDDRPGSLIVEQWKYRCQAMPNGEAPC